MMTTETVMETTTEATRLAQEVAVAREAYLEATTRRSDLGDAARSLVARYRAAVEAGEGEAMARLQEERRANAERRVGAEIAVEIAAIPLYEAERAAAMEALPRAREEAASARFRLQQARQITEPTTTALPDPQSMRMARADLERLTPLLPGLERAAAETERAANQAGYAARAAKERRDQLILAAYGRIEE